MVAKHATLSCQYMPVHKVTHCEDATLQTVVPQGKGRQFRLTTDWTAFAVEHLSKWWNMAKYDDDNQQKSNSADTERDGRFVAYQRIVRNLVHYTLRVLSTLPRQSSSSSSSSSSLRNVTQQTLATIAYLPYRSKKQPQLARRLTIVNVAALMAALMKHGFGRIILLCHTDDFVDTARNVWPQAVQLLQTALQNPTNWTTMDPNQWLDNLLAQTLDHSIVANATWYSDTVCLHNSQL